MKKILALLVFLFLGTPAFAQFGALTITSTQGSGLPLSWVSGPGGTITINRAPWTFDNSIAPMPIATTTGTTYLDTTAVPNTLYIYSVSQGANKSNTYRGVLSDITLPFNCPPMVPVAPSLLGVDRTVSWVGANGVKTSFTVKAPVPAAQLAVTTVSPCNGAPACSDYTNIRTATASVTAAGPGTVRLQAGASYVFTEPTSTANIYIPNATDFIFDGNGAFVNFTNVLTTGTVSYGVLVAFGNRVLVKGLAIDWQFPNAIPGVMNNIVGDSTHQRFNIQNPTYYILDPTNPPTVRGLAGYRLTNRAYNLTAGARVGVGGTFNTNFMSDGLYYYLISGKFFPDGTEAILYTPSQAPTGFQVGASSDTSVENVAIYGGAGPGIVATRSSGNQRGLRLSNFTIDRKPDAMLAPGEQPRYIALYGDSDSNTTLGEILIENSQFGLIDDDTFYNRGTSQQIQSLASTTSFTTTAAPARASQGSDTIQFLDPATLAQIGSQVTAAWTVSGGTWTATFPAVPQLASYIGLAAASLPIVTEPDWNSPTIAFRNSCAHDNHGRIYIGAKNALIENNVTANSYYGTIYLDTFPVPLGNAESTPPSNVIVSNNNVIGTNYGLTDLNWFGTSNGYSQANASAPIYITNFGSTGFVTDGYPNKSVEVFGNFIANTNGLCITMMGVNNGAVVNNTCVDANSIAYTAGFQATFCGGNSQPVQPAGANQPWCLAKAAAQGSIMVAHSKNVDTTSTPNTFLGTSFTGTCAAPLTGTGGVCTDTSTVSKDNIVGSRFVH